MAKVQPTIVKISYNGPFTSCQTAPFFFSQTVRNIALGQPLTTSKRVSASKSSALKTKETENGTN